MSTTDETERAADLRRYRILDTGPEPAFDDLATLASHICGAPIALITLAEGDRLWFKSHIGMSQSETSRSGSFCSRSMQQRELFVVPDALADERFRDSPMVTGVPHVRFYAGASLASGDGRPLGSLCVIDRVPRTLTAAQREALDALRRQAEAQLDLRLRILELREALADLGKLSGLLPLCSACQFDAVVPADWKALDTVTDGVSKMLQEKGWPDADVQSVELALREALANAIRHGCGNDPSKQVQVYVTYDQAGEIVIVIRDPGPGFDATAVPDPLEPQNLFRASGRGVFLINQLMDTVGYRAGGREVEMRKRRGAGAV